MPNSIDFFFSFLLFFWGGGAVWDRVFLSKPGRAGTPYEALAGPESNRDPPDSDPSNCPQGWGHRHPSYPKPGLLSTRNLHNPGAIYVLYTNLSECIPTKNKREVLFWGSSQVSMVESESFKKWCYVLCQIVYKEIFLNALLLLPSF